MRGSTSCLLTLCVIMAAPAPAQRVQYHQERIEKRDVAKISPEAEDLKAEARRVLNDYAECIVKRNRPRVEQVLGKLPAPESGAEYSRLATHHCLYEGTLRFNASIFRGSLFEALYTADFGDESPAVLPTTPPIDYSSDAEGAVAEPIRTQIAVRQFADCVVRQRSSDARALLLSEVASEEEREAFDRLVPALSGCIPQGLQVAFSKSILRGLIAETTYRLTVAAADAGAGGSEK